MDGDIQFGEVQQARPRRRRRPDQDRHFAVCDCGTPGGDDLPIFVEMDVWAEIEAHARSDTNVELGGVLLGGQFEDQDGKPFVLVLDSLRAEHYESSGTHFKFTPETWTEITRQRDQFADDMLMVGWYHTHPNLGVFLSSMDRFICENFFNRPLDVALVVDPLRGDRGWFYWGAGGGQRLPRAKGFGVTASRFRRQELQTLVGLLEEDATMSTHRLTGGLSAGADLRLPQQVIHTIRPQLGWLGAAVLAMLVLQVGTTLLLALRFGLPAPAGQRAGPSEPVIVQEAATEMALREQRLAAREAVFRDLLGRVEVDADGRINLGSLVEDYKQLRQEAAERRKTDLLLDEAAKWIGQDRRQFQAKIRALAQSNQELTADHKRLLAQIAKLQDLRKADQEEIEQLQSRIAQTVGEGIEEESASRETSWRTVLAAAAGLLIAGALAAVIVVLRGRRRA